MEELEKKSAKLVAAELLRNPEFIRVLGKAVVLEANRRGLNKRVTEMIAENKVMFRKGKG